MEEKSSNFWWLKNKSTQEIEEPDNTVYAEKEFNVSTNSLMDILEKESENFREKGDLDEDVDVGSIIEEINRVAAQSPLGPFDNKLSERSVDELMREAEKIYMESSKSFEQLSQRSKTSQNISEISSGSENSTPTPKSVSPLPLDTNPDEIYADKIIAKDDREVFYSEDFSDDSKIDSSESTPSVEQNLPLPSKNNFSIKQSFSERNINGKVDYSIQNSQKSVTGNSAKNSKISSNKLIQSMSDTNFLVNRNKEVEEKLEFELKRRDIEMKQMDLKNDLIQALEEDNSRLKTDMFEIKNELEKTQMALKELRSSSKARTPDVTVELEKTLDELKDTKEVNTALQLQLDTLTQTHVLLKNAQEDLLNQNRNLERRLADVDTSLAKYKHELLNVQRHRDKLMENELSLNKLLDIEKIQTRSLKAQNETDAKCIQDLNRQIKEMERIIARKHPDSVSALIMAAKTDATDSNLTARKLLEDRIKTLELELQAKEKQSSQVFNDIQEKFNQMKAKYENHIEDLELHVNDLKDQLKKKNNCFDMYTQTPPILVKAHEIPEKETTSVSTQTDSVPTKPPKVIAVKTSARVSEGKSESHLLATIRGLQSDLSCKEKAILKMQREMDEIRKTNKRLQKEREGSLKSINGDFKAGKDFKNFPEKLAVVVARTKSPTDSKVDVTSREELDSTKSDFETVKQQLYRIEMDYQNLKKKRIHDLNALQEAHEREIAEYIKNLQPLREQLELQQLSINTLQTQLACTKEELAIVTVERDHLNDQMAAVDKSVFCTRNVISDTDVVSLQKKLAAVEKKYEEREHRLRAIVNSLAKRSVMNGNCEQCEERQKQLIAYKNELDHIMASVRALK
ncbi:centrosomal protein of 162 kDa [Coccinella septempunctata]|uniref:centrosomal protein of 162 kDa n=1 Tax=Coccinella septempunctata TaxID=41139 RepID=UPI001D08E6A0|nr:centrosomal protein of 162 kDa [Coccinella septempunctata]